MTKHCAERCLVEDAVGVGSGSGLGCEQPYRLPAATRADHLVPVPASFCPDQALESENVSLMKTLRTYLLLLAALAASAAASHAAVLITLANPNPVTTPGTIIPFLASAFNNDNVLVNLNNLNNNVDPALTFDDSAFLSNWLAIAANSSFDANPQELFAITVPVGTAPGTYLGNIDLLGGPDINDQNILGSASFSVTVNAASSGVPEPGSILLVATGLGLAFLRTRR